MELKSSGSGCQNPDQKGDPDLDASKERHLSWDLGFISKLFSSLFNKSLNNLTVVKHGNFVRIVRADILDHIFYFCVKIVVELFFIHKSPFINGKF